MADEKIAVLIIDGLGFGTKTEQAILTDVIADLPKPIADRIAQSAAAIVAKCQLDASAEKLITMALLAPTITSLLAESPGALWANRACIDALNAARSELRKSIDEKAWVMEVLARLKGTAIRYRYAPWAAST